MMTNWYSSTSPAAPSCAATLPLPRIAMPGPSPAFSSRTAATRSPFSSCVFCHVGWIVRDATYLRAAFIPFATSGICAAATGVGQNASIC